MGSVNKNLSEDFGQRRAAILRVPTVSLAIIIFFSITQRTQPLQRKLAVKTNIIHKELERWLGLKSSYCSCRGPEFSSQQPHLQAYNCLYLHLQGSDTFLWPPWALHSHTHYTNILFISNMPLKIIIYKSQLLGFLAEQRSWKHWDQSDSQIQALRYSTISQKHDLMKMLIFFNLKEEGFIYLLVLIFETGSYVAQAVFDFDL